MSRIKYLGIYKSGNELRLITMIRLIFLASIPSFDFRLFYFLSVLSAVNNSLIPEFRISFLSLSDLPVLCLMPFFSYLFS